ncbi:hypothetical protein AT1G75945 [Arabidopsis thaliana]|uniref:Uncharacterized protein n=1 Tax=Arabidopsis thaliana TaxID=3702 RepID=A0A1P8ATP0_ARATH|nr:uncharacterized protein AT1G75945 [Arabidopsis thaliana]ANM59987.1 hypothetical protein AT1G75945 [Arabidopsis thaliana]|eukprot:NP_001322302.1 hypothetical protein AT1G75945 [Arabidopsis thaliana]
MNSSSSKPLSFSLISVGLTKNLCSEIQPTTSTFLGSRRALRRRNGRSLDWRGTARRRSLEL